MEQKDLFVSGLGVGVGVGVGLGLGLASARRGAGATLGGGGATGVEVEAELRQLLVDGRAIGGDFYDFADYYLSDQTRLVLTGAAYIHLRRADLSKHIRNLSAGSRAILLSGPAEPYMQSLAKALSHQSDARLLLLDVTDFSLRIQREYGSSSNASISSHTTDLASQCSGNSVSRTTSCCFDEKILVESLYKVIVSVSESNPVMLYIRDVDHFLNRSEIIYSMFQKMLRKLSGPVLVLGSRLLDDKDVDEKVSTLFPYSVEIKLPKEETHPDSWKIQMEEEMKRIQRQDNRNHIIELLSANDLDCDDLSSICLPDTMVLRKDIEKIIVLAFSYHLMDNKDPKKRDGKIIIPSESLSLGLSIFQGSSLGGKGEEKLDLDGAICQDDLKSIAKFLLSQEGNKTEKSTTVPVTDETSPSLSPKPEVPDNKFEKLIRQEVIPASEIGVTFDDIGALACIKKSLQELVMLPFQRPDLFKEGRRKPCRGILLFGPPGTGKTMLAKAIANEAGASFINVSMPTITSKLFGEDVKIIRAVFSLAAKVAPTIIFVDEVDSMLGKQGRVGENETMWKIKNEFVRHWDGLSKSCERILVLAETNRPFDIDEAIIWRFEHRFMVDLPTLESRELILRMLLSKMVVDGIDFKVLATMTEGYSGSDLQNLCMTAAYRPVSELHQEERERKLEMEKSIKEKAADKSEKLGSKKDGSEGKEGNSESKEDNLETKVEGEKEETTVPRPLTMEDLRRAKDLVGPSFSTEDTVMDELKQWNDLYGEGGSRKRHLPSYYM